MGESLSYMQATISLWLSIIEWSTPPSVGVGHSPMLPSNEDASISDSPMNQVMYVADSELDEISSPSAAFMASSSSMLPMTV